MSRTHATFAFVLGLVLLSQCGCCCCVIPVGPQPGQGGGEFDGVAPEATLEDEPAVDEGTLDSDASEETDEPAAIESGASLE